MRVSIATFNVENLVTADKRIYNEPFVRYNKEQYQKKIAWIQNQLITMDADIIGFQEIFEEQALRDCLKGTAMENWHLAVANPNGKTPVNALLSKFPILNTTIISDIPNAFDFFDDENAVNAGTITPIPIQNFSRAVLKAEIKISEEITISALVLHLKSKRPILPPDLDSRKATFTQVAQGSIRSLIRRGVEACGIRQILSDEISTNKTHPIFVLGDLNDSDTAVTNQVILGNEPYFNLPVEDKIEKWKYVFQNSIDVQARKAIQNFHFTYIHNGHYESLDNIFISNHLADTNPNRLGRIIDVRAYNDHVIDDKVSKDKKPFYVSDHGQAVVNVEFNPERIARFKKSTNNSQ